MEKQNRSKRFNLKNRKTVFIVSIVGILLLASMLIEYPTPAEESGNKIVEETVRKISVELISPSTYSAAFTLLGQAVPEWHTVLRSHVSGQITGISPAFHTGARVKKGEILVRIEQSGYLNAVSEAKLRVATAEYNLMREQSEAREAEKSWKESGLKDTSPSPLLLRKPQMKAAEAELKAAESALVRAETELSYTFVKAPYTGIIIKRKVSPGDTLLQGEEAAQMYSTNKILVTIYINEKQSSLLHEDKKDIKVLLYSEDRKQKWEASVLERGSHIETDTRLIPLVLEVSKPLDRESPLLPGRFLTAVLKGKPVKNLLCIEETAVTGEGYVWYINDEGQLERYKPGYVFREGTKLYINPPGDVDGEVEIATNPDSTYIRGLQVEAAEGE